MTKNQLQKALEAYGFTRREAGVFLALVECLEGPVTEIANEASLPRSTVQTILEKIREKGFAETFTKNGVLHYTPTSLNKLVTDLKEKEEIIQKALPSLQGLIDSRKEGSSLQVVYGKAGVKSAFNDLLDLYRGGLRNVYAVSNTTKLIELFPKFFPEWAQKEAVYPVDVQMLVPNGAAVHDNTKANSRMSLRFVPQKYAFPGDMTIAGSKVFFFHLEEENPHVYIIDSKEVAEIQSSIFHLLWELSE
jgi:sugar-specific transcriptional regulator TrmB